MANHDIAPINRPRAAARPAYDRLSRIYDPLAGTFERRLTRRTVAGLDLAPGSAALDLGCGTGWGLAALRAAVGPAGHVVGLDLSGGMLRQARRRTAGSLAQGDAAALPLGAACFDAVLLSFTLELFSAPDMKLVLAGCRRVLRPGGQLAVVALSRARGATRPVRLYEWAHARWPALVDCRPILAAAAIATAGFAVRYQEAPTLWGLPVELVVAVRFEPAGRANATSAADVCTRLRRPASRADEVLMGVWLGHLPQPHPIRICYAGRQARCPVTTAFEPAGGPDDAGARPALQ